MRITLLALVLAASFGLLDPLGSLLASVWNPSATSKVGLGWDPDGLNSPTPPQTEAGCGWDPSGQNSCTPPEQL
jgi:hypothetical protein